MKKIICGILFFIFAACFCAAQTSPKAYTLKNGIPVYVKPDAESEVSAVYVVVKGGVRCLTPETSGLEAAVFSLMAKGSEKYPYEELKSFAYQTQGGFSSYSINDGSVFGMSCITKYFDESYNRFEDSFFAPKFSENEYRLVMQNYRQEVAGTMNDPGGMLMYYMNQILYAGHPYAAKPYVTIDSVDNITLEAIKHHYESLLDSRKISIVASGNIDCERLVAVLNRSFGKIKKGSGALMEDSIPEIKVKGEPCVLSHASAAGGGIVLRAFASPKVTDSDYGTARIVERIYGDILYSVVREKYGVCYTPVSEISSSEAPYGAEILYRVSDLKGFQKALDEARGMMLNGKLIAGKDNNGNFLTDKIEDRLEGYKNSYITGKYSTQATVGGVCSRMAASLLQFGDIDSADGITEAVKSCSADDVRRVFKKYWIDESSQWFAVVGPEDEDNISFD